MADSADDDEARAAQGRITVVIITHNRADSLRRTLENLSISSPAPRVNVVGNGCTDHTADVVGEFDGRFPEIRYLALHRNHGAVGRNIGVREANTPYIAFCDDDSWWAPDSLRTAVTILDGAPTVALLSARTLVGERARPDPINESLAHSPIPTPPELPGPAIRGFLACAAVVRRDVFLDVGGFSDVLGFVGEEALLALDLVVAGWELCYAAELVVHHFPSAQRPPSAVRTAHAVQNEPLTHVMRRPIVTCLRSAITMLGSVARGHVSPTVILDVARRLPAAVAQRQPIPAPLEAQLQELEATSR